MSANVSNERLAQLSDFISAHMGLDFPRQRWPDLERGIASASSEFGFEDGESCIQWLMSSVLSKRQIEILASHLTIGETYFFRDPKTFQLLEEHILPPLIRSRQGNEQRLRIWSAGCATGEEPYSIAIAVGKLLPNWQDWKITIRATDINPRSLQKAAAGRYSEWSFRGTPSWIKDTWFRQKSKNRFEILPSLKRMVVFSYLNLAVDTYPSLWTNTNAMDVIFCRNVLMYFTSERAKAVINNLFRCLVDGGWLVVSPTEASPALCESFIPIHFSGITLYRKDLTAALQHERYCVPQDEMAEMLVQPLCPVPAHSESEAIGLKEDRKSSPAQPQHSEPIRANMESHAMPKLLSEQGLYSEAEQAIKKNRPHRVEKEEEITLLARLCANRGELAEALEWCNKAIAADKLNPSLHYLRATILQEQGATDEAKASLNRTLYLDPQFVLAHFALGYLAVRQEQQKEASKHFGNALALLAAYPQEASLPQAEGLTAGRLVEILRAMNFSESTG